MGRLVLGVLGESGQMGTMLARVYGQSGAVLGDSCGEMGESKGRMGAKDA